MKKLISTVTTTLIDDTSDRLLVHFANESAPVKEDAFLKPLFGNMQKVSDQITEAIKKSVVLSKMEEADAIVENAFRNTTAIIKGYRAMPLEAQRTAAAALSEVTDKYKLDILRLPYGSQSSNIEAFLMDISAPALKPHIESLAGLAESLAELRKNQTEFTARRVAYEDAIATQGTPSATHFKKELLKLINGKLIPYLEAMAIANPDTYGSFYNKVETAVEKTNLAVRTGGKDTENPEQPK